MAYDLEKAPRRTEEWEMLHGIASHMVVMLQSAVSAVDLRDREDVRNRLRTIQIAMDLLGNALTLMDEHDVEANTQQPAAVLSLHTYRLARGVTGIESRDQQPQQSQ